MPRSLLPAPSRLIHGARRRTLVVLACLALAFAAALTPATLAGAASGPFAIDQQVPDPGTTLLADDAGKAKELGPKNSNTTKIGVIHSAATPMLDMTNPNAQVDLRNAWVKLQRQAGIDWLYFAWERDANTGSGFIAFEFMKDALPAACDYDASTDAQLIASCNPWANRQGTIDANDQAQSGDFLILWDQQGGGKDLFMRTWLGKAPNLTLSAPQQLPPSVFEADYGHDGFRGEAAINLTEVLDLTPGACLSFANVIPSTVTGNSDTADYKDTILKEVPPLGGCTASIATTPKDGTGAAIPVGGLSIGSGVVAVQDSATISLSGGTATPTGSLTFHLCGPTATSSTATCETGGTNVGSTSIAGGSYPKTVSSPTAYVTSAGRYCWRAEWPGDAANGIPPAKDSAATECFVVNPVTPTLSTTAGGGGTLGSTVTDSAVLGGTATQPADPVINLTGTPGPAAGGTITFQLYGPSTTGCGSLVHTPTAVTVNGNGTYATPTPAFAPTTVGTYHWVATYSGSSPNTSSKTHNSDCTDTAERVSITTVASSLRSTQSWVPNDSARISASAGGDLAGTVHFRFFDNGTCTGTPVWTESETVAGASPQTVGTSNTTAETDGGSYSFEVEYDSTNPAQRDIPASCHETSSLTIDNGGTVSSP